MLVLIILGKHNDEGDGKEKLNVDYNTPHTKSLIKRMKLLNKHQISAKLRLKYNIR